MTVQQPFLIVNKSCAEAVQEVVQALATVNLQVLRTFDLQLARATRTHCGCPQHETEACDCQYVVLLIYEDELPPSSLIAHGHDGKTWFMWVDPPGQHANSGYKITMKQALLPPVAVPSGEGVQSAVYDRKGVIADE